MDTALKEHHTRLIDELSSGQRDDGATLTDVDRLARFAQLVQSGAVPSIVSGLPLLLSLKGEPLTLENQFPFEDMFRFVLPNCSDYMTGRQIGKTVSQAAEGLLKTSTIPNITTLYITPLYEQIRRFSVSYVNSMITTSPVKQLMIGTKSTQNVLYRNFLNNSSMVFSFAGLSVERVRGIPADLLNVDEADDVLEEHLPVIESTLHASQYRIIRRTGTPKTQDRTLARCWAASSQAEWFVPCFHCTENGKPRWNIPSMEYHLEQMIGPLRDDISEKNPATICYHCGKPISPRQGRWRHRYPDRRWTHAGYHIPQIIMPMHYGNWERWRDLLRHQLAWPTYRFCNEVLGEPYDLAAKLVTQTQLQAAAHNGALDPRAALKRRNRYRGLVMGVDWGGGGEVEDASFTVIAVAGLCHDGRIEVIWGKRLLTPHDHIGEAKEVLFWWKWFKPQLLVHDNGGAGATRETILRLAGFKENVLMPCEYIGPSRGDIVVPVPPTDKYSRFRYRVDKSRALQLVCQIITIKGITFFDWDKVSDDMPGLISDFLALTEHKSATVSAGEIYRISKMPGRTDDFAHAVTYASLGLWFKYNAWPDMIKLGIKPITEAQLKALVGDVNNWKPKELR